MVLGTLGELYDIASWANAGLYKTAIEVINDLYNKTNNKCSKATHYSAAGVDHRDTSLENSAFMRESMPESMPESMLESGPARPGLLLGKWVPVREQGRKIKRDYNGIICLQKS
jgi:hypothetical protein